MRPATPANPPAMTWVGMAPLSEVAEEAAADADEAREERPPAAEETAADASAAAEERAPLALDAASDASEAAEPVAEAIAPVAEAPADGTEVTPRSSAWDRK